MPWYCGYCSAWNKSTHRVCPSCGRPAKGRLCRRCRADVPKDASYCTNCGSSRLTEAAVRKLPLPTTLPLRLALLAGILLLLWLAIHLLRWVLHGALSFAAHALVWVVVAWLLTGILPRPWGAKARGAVWTTLKYSVEFLRNLFS
ncbi:MAG: double zinc ribbon domain-containing protein [Armatimonadota bacterium]